MDRELFIRRYLRQRASRIRRKIKRIQIMKRAFAAKFMELLLAASVYKAPRAQNIKRSEETWIHFHDVAGEDEFKEAFRVSRQTFNRIVRDLRPMLEPIPNLLSRIIPVSVEKKVALTLYKLSSCCEYRTVGNVFGLHKTTVQKHFHNVVKKIVEFYLKNIIFLPDVNECEVLAGKFLQISGIPQIIGAIDGCHIPIHSPEEGRADFTNRKQYGSIVMQAVVDNEYKFRDICIKFPGSCHDAYIFRNSNLFKYHDREIPESRLHMDGIKIPYIIVGDPAYPLLPWLMKDYPGHNLPPEQERFNHALNRSRVFVECTFGRLKARFRTLQNPSEIYYRFMPMVIGACCILNNLIEDEYEPTVVATTQGENILYPQPPVEELQERGSREGKIVRDVLMRNRLRRNNN
ncbi:hypothetical protein DMENIID0001_045710 [Sergentomyia squamirostris]